MCGPPGRESHSPARDVYRFPCHGLQCEAPAAPAVNGTSIPVGGCQFKLRAGDKVAFTWTAF